MREITDTAHYSARHRGGSGEPLLLVHGFTDTWRTWELALPFLERGFNVLAPTLPGHAGGPPLPGRLTDTTFVEFLESLLDGAGWERPLVAGNSLGGWLALQLAARGRARAAVAFAPAGDPASVETLPYFRVMHRLVRRSAPIADRIAATDAGRRRMTKDMTVNYRHIPPGLLAHQLVGAARCEATLPLIAFAEQHGWPLDTAAIEIPVRIVWGTEDAILAWPRSAERYRRELPQADWVELEGVGHAPQLDVPAVASELVRSFA